MTRDNTEYLEQAELALAAYAKDLTAGRPDKESLKTAGLSDIQADKFIAQYTVVDQHTDPTGPTGLSATVFKSTDPENPQTFLAIRGTEILDPGDMLTNLINIALFGDTTLHPQYISLKSKVQEWLDAGKLPQNFTVTGHSLGGFLATDLTVDSQFANNITHAYLYNTPGQNGIFGDLIKMMTDAWGVATKYDPAKFSNIEAVVSDGFNIRPIAGLGYEVAPPINIMIEDQLGGVAKLELPGLNHSTKTLNDIQAVQQPYSPHTPDMKSSGWTLNRFKNSKFFLNINKYLRKLFFGLIFTFFINQGAYSEEHIVNSAIDEDFIAWSNSIPLEEAEIQLRDFLSSFDSWDEAEAWLAAQGLNVKSALLSEVSTKTYGLESPAFTVGAYWDPKKQGTIFANGWIFYLLDLLLPVHGVSIQILYTNIEQIIIHDLVIIKSRL